MRKSRLRAIKRAFFTTIGRAPSPAQRNRLSEIRQLKRLFYRGRQSGEITERGLALETRRSKQ